MKMQNSVKDIRNVGIDTDLAKLNEFLKNNQAIKRVI